MSNNFSYLIDSFPFNGKYENVQNYKTILIEYYTASTDTLTISYSNDTVNVYFTTSYIISGQQQIVINPIYTFFKINIVSNNTSQAIVRYCACKYLTDLFVFNSQSGEVATNVSDADTHGGLATINATLTNGLIVSDTITHTNTANTVTALSTANATLNDINTKLTTPNTIIKGINSSGSAISINASDQGNLCVEINGSNSAFGDILTTSMNQILHNTFIYGTSVNSEQNSVILQNNGNVSIANNLLICTTNGSANSNAYVRSRQLIKYSPGIGVAARFTAIFNTINANTMLIGLGTTECGIYFGNYLGSFSAIVVTAAYRQIVQLIITNGTTTAGNIILTLNNISYTISKQTTGLSANNVAYIIANYNYNDITSPYPGWTATVSGIYITFISNTPGLKNIGNNLTGYSITGIGVTGTFKNISDGADGTITQAPQSTWNIDKMDGTGPSRMNLNITKGNVYWIKYQYLGFGQITFGVENPKTGKLVPVHQIQYANANITISLSNPAMPFSMSNFGSAANSISCGSYAAFIEGNPGIPAIVRNYQYTTTALTTVVAPIFSLRNLSVYNSRVNQSTISPLSLNIANGSNKTIIIYLTEDCKLNTLNFTPISTSTTSTSIVEVDTTATSISSSGIERLAICVVANSNQIINLVDYNIITEPGSIMTISGKTASAAQLVDVNVNVNVAIQWIENQ
jgi:hypothetical protein